jgi:CheY-like chemotaxis protein
MDELRLLVIDNCRENADSFSKTLIRTGHHVQTACDGDKIALSDPCLFDVIFVAIALPETDGRSLLMRIRNDARCTDAMFVAVTGHGDELYQIHSREAGFHLHLVQPINPGFLREILEQAIRGRAIKRLSLVEGSDASQQEEREEESRRQTRESLTGVQPQGLKLGCPRPR